MLMGNFLRNRKSIRDFKRESVEAEKLEEVRTDMKALEKEGQGDFAFRLFEDGERIREALAGKAGYAGVMIEAPHYIALDILKDSDSALIYGAYYMEKLITELNKKDLSTCWISLDEVDEKLKKELFGKDIKDIGYILAFGYEKPHNPFTSEEPYSVKFGIEDFVFDEKLEREVERDKLETYGLIDLFYYIRFAPSTKNLQPWRFLFRDDTTIELLLAFEDWDRHLLVDAGIIMYYFEELGRYAGINNKWQLIDGEIYQGEQYRYKSIGLFKL
ncbi:MAG: nitroreductase [Tissierellia bacterium]|nr:nitroreductase [Tissierellia bacterium]